MAKEYSVGKVCAFLGVSRSDYYYKRVTLESEEKEIEKAVINCFEYHKGNYGRIRIYHELKDKCAISQHKISRILKENGLVAKSGRPRKKNMAKPTKQQYIEENLIKNKFEIKLPNYLWCSDISEFICYRAKVYVCAIIDVATRRVVGWSISKSQRQQLVQDAFKMAVGRNPNRPEGAVYHSDRGCQFTAKKTKELVEEAGFRKSMSRPGTPSDNQPIESFWKTLKCEMSDIRHLTFEEASRTIASYIELYYNSDRLHSGIGYMIPNEFFTLLCVQKT